jgi:hypothetical protein
MFKWNGSNISDFIKDEKTIIEEGKYKNNVYWKIKHENMEEICLKRNSTTSMGCLIDELKPAFGLEKIGTHWFKFKGKTMIIFKPIIEKGFVVEELTLDQITYKNGLETEVRRIFLFREILGISQNYEKNIVLRKKGFFIKPVSFYEANMNPSHSGKVIPDTILDKWFKKTDLDEAVQKFFNVNKLEDINKTLLDLKNKLVDIFNRVDPNAITNLDEILSRIRSRLQFFLDK